MPLSIVLAYAVLLLVLALALLWSHWPRWLKAVLVAAVTLLYFHGHDTVRTLLGTPSPEALPERFVMLAAVVDEPRGKNPGALYLWITPIEQDKPVLRPRAYRLAYSKTLHEQINEGLRKGREGVSQMGTAEFKADSGVGRSWLLPGQDEQEIKIRDMPLPQLPDK